MENKKPASKPRNPNIRAFQIRIPKDLYEELKKYAKLHHRSLNGEVIHWLQTRKVNQRREEAQKRAEEDTT